MPRKKKLKVGDIVKAYFLSSPCKCEVIRVIDKNSYNLKQIDGTILPGVKWKKDMDKKSPWYIYEFLGHNNVAKSTEGQNTIEHTTDKVELEKAIKKQAKFIKGTVNK
tara:strand:- start:365 stop:688 length:324 start_codon:yes stop_codon:yes gene_type:complete